jgi:hypothetical protein
MLIFAPALTLDLCTFPSGARSANSEITIRYLPSMRRIVEAQSRIVFAFLRESSKTASGVDRDGRLPEFRCSARVSHVCHGDAFNALGESCAAQNVSHGQLAKNAKMPKKGIGAVPRDAMTWTDIKCDTL